MSAILPKYKCVAIAHEVSRTLNLPWPLPWQQVRDYAAPRLPGMEGSISSRYDADMRRLIARRLDVELRHQHLWRPGE